MAQGLTSTVGSTLVSNGSSNSMCRVCWPTVMIMGVWFCAAVMMLVMACPTPAPVCRLTTAGVRVACAYPSAIATTDASCNAST